MGELGNDKRCCFPDNSKSTIAVGYWKTDNLSVIQKTYSESRRSTETTGSSNRYCYLSSVTAFREAIEWETMGLAVRSSFRSLRLVCLNLIFTSPHDTQRDDIKELWLADSPREDFETDA